MTHDQQAAWPVWLPQRLLPVEEVAALLKVSPRTVRRLIEQKKLAILRVGRTVRIRPEVLADFIDCS